MLDRMRKNPLRDSNSVLDSTTDAVASREPSRTQTVVLTPRQKESLEILNDLFEEEYGPKIESREFTEV